MTLLVLMYSSNRHSYKETTQIRGVRTKLLKSASLLDRRRSETVRGKQENVCLKKQNNNKRETNGHQTNIAAAAARPYSKREEGQLVH